ncbi:MAG: hypothetical protein IPJ32_07750 [Sphingobacteriaceae bacterium]|nr:hypothetical protein [Sphingobacteriaceae bacterium]
MKKFLFIIFVFLFAGNFAQGQSKSSYKIGDIANETIVVYDTNKVAVNLKVPDENGYLIVYNYRWINAGNGVDSRDSLKVLEDKIAEVIIGGMIGKLRVVCLSYDKDVKYDDWINQIRKENH